MLLKKGLPGFQAIHAIFGVLGWALLGAVVGATASGIYGALFGMLDGLVHADWSRLSLAGLSFFVLCGAGAGVLSAGFVRMIDPEGAADLTSGSPSLHSQGRVVYLIPSTPAISPVGQKWFFESSPFEQDSRIKPSLN